MISYKGALYVEASRLGPKCRHCKGTGKCSCGKCEQFKKEYATGYSWTKKPNACARCEGTGRALRSKV